MKLTKEEQALCLKEHSYRVARACFGTLAFVSGIIYPYFIWSIVTTWMSMPAGRKGEFWSVLQSLNWQGIFSSSSIFVVFFFLAYRANSRLVLIRHLEFHARNNENANS